MTNNTKIQEKLKYKLQDDQKTKINVDIKQDLLHQHGSKKVVLKFRSVNNIVIAPAKTGKDNNNKNAVIKTDHTNKGNLCIFIPGARILIIVVIKLIAPNNEEIPDKCKLKIAKSTEPPEWACNTY